MDRQTNACCNGNLPRVPKIHKDNVPLRIIISSIGSSTYSLARYIQNILPTPKSCIKDSWSFVDKIHNLSIGDNETLLSLDVGALFANIPTELVLMAFYTTIHQHSQTSIRNNCKISNVNY